MSKKQHKNSKKINGSAKEDGFAHELAHRDWSRRLFLRNVGLAGSLSMMFGKIPLTAMASSPLARALAADESDRVLVFIRLKGGNDGLNTIVPLYDYGTYQAVRPDIHIPQNEIIQLSPELGMPNTMSALESLWLDGQMKVINNVGYPNQNLSHFRSTDIWNSASDADVFDSSGWLGRFFDQQYPDFITNPPDDPPAIQIGGFGNILFDNEEGTSLGMTVSNPDQLYQLAQTGQLYDPLNVPECYRGEQLTFLRSIANSTYKYAEIIAEKYNLSSNSVEYTTSLGEQLALVARLIKGGLKTKVYMVSLGGFDTHANQLTNHPALLNDLSEAVKSFYEDLGNTDHAKNVISVTISEFGRRIEQNASGGTDHGAAAPMMVFGEGLEGNGFLGSNPDLTDVDEVGNLKFDIDFRRIYATVLENWLCVDPDVVDDVLGQSFERLPELGLTCMPSSTTGVTQPSINMVLLREEGQITVQYTLPVSMRTRVTVFDLLGRPVEVLYDGQQYQGQHQHVFLTNKPRLTSGMYIFTIETGGTVYSKKANILR